MSEIKSMVEVAYQIMGSKKRAIPFGKLYEEVASVLKFSDEDKKRRVSQFYTDLSLDKRFASLKENKWELSNRLCFKDTYVKTDDLLLEDDDNVYLDIDQEDNLINKFDEEDVEDGDVSEDE